MAWLRITGGVLFIAGMVGLIFGAFSGMTSLALCVVGMAAWGAAVLAERRRGKRDSSGLLDELLDELDDSTDSLSHSSHDQGHHHGERHDHGGGHVNAGGQDHDGGHDADWLDHEH